MTVSGPAQYGLRGFGPPRRADQTDAREATAVSKIKIIAPLLLLARPRRAPTSSCSPSRSEPAPKPKIEGTVYILPKEFLLNLEDGRYAKLNVGLVLDPHQATAAEAGGHGAARDPARGLRHASAGGRASATSSPTTSPTTTRDDLVTRKGRDKLKKKLLKSIKKNTDVKVEEILFTDLAVQ